MVGLKHSLEKEAKDSEAEKQRLRELARLIHRCETLRHTLVAEALHVSSRHVRRLIAKGSLVRVGRGQVKAGSVREWLSSGNSRASSHAPKEKRT